MAKYVGFKVGKVHESHVISEYYCGGCGYPVTDHDSFCPECGGAFQEIDADSTDAENAKLREQMELLVTLLRNDCDIDANWDGLRRFWSIELTEGGCLMRDRACKAEAENEKLRELTSLMQTRSANRLDRDGWTRMHDLIDELEIEVEQ